MDVRLTLDPADPPILSAATAARLDAMTPEEVEANALDDPDNPPLTADELDRMEAARPTRRAQVGEEPSRHPRRRLAR